jgi:mannonate dehydratase
VKITDAKVMVTSPGRNFVTLKVSTDQGIYGLGDATLNVKGKAFGTPVYNLRGGKSRDAVLVYGHANGRGVEETGDEVAKYISLGYKAIRAQTGIPGLASTYGVAKDKMYDEPAEKALPPENSWSTEKYLLHIPKLFESLRVKFGDEVHLLHDVHRLTPIERRVSAKALSRIICSGSKTR